MKKFILIENQVTKLTPFKHFHDLINLQINDSNVGGLGFDDIKPYNKKQNCLDTTNIMLLYI